MMTTTKSVLNELLNLIYPPLCNLCGEPLQQAEKQICLQCLCDLPVIHFASTADNRMAQLFIGKSPFFQAVSWLYYEKGGAVQKLIHQLKYKGNKKLGYELGKLAAVHIMQTHPDFLYPDAKPVDYLIPVPLHRKRLRQRGYNQTEWISRGFSEICKIPLNTTILSRKNENVTQTHKSVFERWMNVQDIFALTRKESIENCHILLIDDVVTTGATLEACLQILREIPGIRISLFSIALA